VTVEVAGPLGGTFRWTFRLPARRDDLPMVEAELGDTVAAAHAEGGGLAQLWVPEVDDAAEEVARAHGFAAYRDLWQLRAPLPVPGEPDDLSARAFDVDIDLDDLVAVNARAFAWHPEQGSMTAEDFRRAMTEPWFRPDGLLLHHVGDRLAGFCWTKIHGDTAPPLGEIYVIAVDPDFHGRGLGPPMTRAGLDHLATEGLDTAMLYVEADNIAANRVYERLGFRRHHTDRAYRASI
jgi:mycothiol synthase